MLSIFKKEPLDTLILLKFLIGSSGFLIFFWKLIAFFSALGVVGLVIDSKALMFTGYIISLILIFFNLIQVPISFRSALTRKTWFLCGNAYNQLLWLVIFMGLLFSLLLVPLFYHNYSNLIQVVSLYVVAFGLYTFFVVIAVVFHMIFSWCIVAIIAFIFPGFGVEIIYNNYYFLISCVVFFCVMWVFLACNMRRLKKPGFEFSSEFDFFSKSYSNNYDFFGRLVLCIPNKILLFGSSDKIYLLVAEKSNSVFITLLVVLYKVFLLYLFMVVVSVIGGEGYSVSLFFEGEFFSEGLVLPCVILFGIEMQRKIVSNARRLWLMVGGSRGGIFLLIEKYCVHNICVELSVTISLLVSILLFSKDYNADIWLFFIAAVFLFFLVFYLNMVTFCLHDTTRTLVSAVLTLGLMLFVILHAVFNHIAATLTLVAILGASVWVARHYAIKLWLRVDFRAGKA